MDKTKPVAAIVGGGSLLGREVRELLVDTPIRMKLIGADRDETGLLTEEAGEPAVMTQLDEENLAGARLAFLTGSTESSRKALELIARLDPRPALIDLTYTLEERPGASLRAPMVEPANYAAAALAEHVIAHPAAIVLALFLTRLRSVRPIRRSVAHIFEPASERGQRGIEELEKQTVNLLTFKKLPKAVYDEQVGFNMLARYGSAAPESIQSVETRIARHLATLLSIQETARDRSQGSVAQPDSLPADASIPMPSLRLIQAPVFHGHSFSVWVAFDEDPGTETLERELACAHSTRSRSQPRSSEHCRHSRPKRHRSWRDHARPR